MEMVEYSEDQWAIGTVYCLYQKSNAFAKEVRGRLKGSEGMERLTLLYAIGKNRQNSFFRMFENMLYWKELPLGLMGAFDQAEWGGRAEHIVEFLSAQGRVQEMAEFLGRSIKVYRKRIGKDVSVGIAGRLLEAVVICEDSWDKYAIGSFLAANTEKEGFLKLYHCLSPKLKTECNFYVLPYIRSAYFDDFTEEEIGLMMEDLKHFLLEDVNYEDEVLLVNIAPPQFLEHKIVPMLENGTEKEQANARRILELAGEKYGRRYVSR